MFKHTHFSLMGAATQSVSVHSSHSKLIAAYFCQLSTKPWLDLVDRWCCCCKFTWDCCLDENSVSTVQLYQQMRSRGFQVVIIWSCQSSQDTFITLSITLYAHRRRVCVCVPQTVMNGKLQLKDRSHITHAINNTVALTSPLGELATSTVTYRD